MLFERRTYTLKPGAIARFWQAQVDRGFEQVEPIMQRMVGYFSGQTGPSDQVIHLYRYDSFTDWQDRLHGLYRVAELETYFHTVRALMVAQENQFFTTAPLLELTPLWGNGNDWLPGQPLPFAPLARDATVEEVTTLLLPGTVPKYWDAWCASGQGEPLLSAGQRIGSFVSITGRLHQIVEYRVFSDHRTLEDFRESRERDPAWQQLQQAIAPMVVKMRTRLLSAAPIPRMTPLFEPREILR